MRRGKLLEKGKKVFSGLTKMYHILIVVLVAQVHAIIKTHQAVHLEDVCILFCENYRSIKKMFASHLGLPNHLHNVYRDSHSRLFTAVNFNSGS